MKIKCKNEFRNAAFIRVDQEKRSAFFACSSEYPVERFDGSKIYREILSHQEQDVNLERLKNGAPLIDSHHGDVIGVVEDVSLDEGKRLNVAVRFGSSARAEEIFQDVKNGIRRNVSIGYFKTKAIQVSRAADGVCDIRFQWTPYEVSFVAVPADPTVGIGREMDIVEESRTVPEKIKIILINRK